MLALVAALFAPSLAHAGVVTASAAGGWDFPTRQLWSGVEVALHPTNDKGFALAGALTPAWGFADRRPMAIVDVGLVHVVPSQRATVRFGLFTRQVITNVDYRTPVTLIGGDHRSLGTVPAVQLDVDVEFGTERIYTFGGRAGLGSASFNFRCTDPSELAGCVVWDVGFVGGASFKARLPSGLSADLMIGPTPKLAVGYAF